MTKWEYKTIKVVYDGIQQPFLDELGDKGWELCSIITLDKAMTSFFFFKRPKL